MQVSRPHPGHLPRHVRRTPSGYLARVPLGPIDRAELGTHDSPGSAARAVRMFVIAVRSADIEAVVVALIAAGVVPAGTLPQWVRRVATPDGDRFIGRAVVGGLPVDTRRHADPWSAHADVRRKLVREMARQASGRRRRKPSEYDGVRWTGRGWQARKWVGGGRSLNLGHYTRATHGDAAEWAAGAAYRAFLELHEGLGMPAAEAFRELKRRHLVPQGCRSKHAVGAEGGATCSV